MDIRNFNGRLFEKLFIGTLVSLGIPKHAIIINDFSRGYDVDVTVESKHHIWFFMLKTSFRERYAHADRDAGKIKELDWPKPFEICLLHKNERKGNTIDQNIQIVENKLKRFSWCDHAFNIEDPECDMYLLEMAREFDCN